jgi:ATP-dependent DNA ligase
MCDQEAPGRYIAQPKYDGYRRLAHVDNGKVQWQAKRTAEAAPMVNQYAAELTLLLPRDLEGCSLDCEYVGPRTCMGQRPEPKLCVFDLLRYRGKWLRTTPFSERLVILAGMFSPLIRTASNPGLMDFFLEQMQDATSEGIVVRRADSGLILDESRCRDNPMWWKVKNR